MASCNCNHDPCGGALNQLATRSAQYAQYTAGLYEDFNQKYLGSRDVAPVPTPENPIQEGALYWNSSQDKLYVWNGSSWTPTIDAIGGPINVKTYGATGNGTTDDTAAIQAAINAAPSGAAIYFPSGSYLAAKILISKSITIFGDGIDVTEWVYSLNTGVTAAPPSADAYFVVSGQNTEFDISNGTIIDKFGLRYVGNDVITTAIGCADAYSTNVASFPKQIKVFNVKVVDFWDGIWLNTKRLIVENCNFVLTYGKASIGQPKPIGGTISGHPNCGILSVYGSSIIKNNKYDGLEDYTFSNANAGYLPYRTGGDGFVYIQFRDWAFTAWNTNFDGKHECSNNVIVNHYVEGIQYSYPAVTVAPPITNSLVISNNSIRSTQKNFVDAWSYMPSIAVVLGDFKPNIKIVSNNIENTPIGIDVNANSIADGYGNIEISNNVLNGVVVGISVSKLSEKDIISNNTIFCQSKPRKNALAYVNSQGIYGPDSYSSLFGIYVMNCNPLVVNNTLEAEYDWELVTTLVSQNSNVLTLSSVTGIVPGFGLTFLLSNDVRVMPVLSVSGNNVTVDPAWLGGATITPGATGYYSRNATPATAGIVVVNQQANLKQNFFGTTIKGFLRDMGSVDYPNLGGQSSTLHNTTTINVQQQTATRFPGGVVKIDGFYYKL